MAQRTEVVLIDDVDGGEASQTVTFGLDGVSYEIDLSDDNAAQLRESLSRWVEHGRRQGRSQPSSGGRSRSAGRPRGGGSTDSTAVREWARSNGYTVSERGRISAQVLAAYNARND